MQLCTRKIDEMSVYVTSYVVPVIYSPVSNQEIQSAVECYPYLQGLQLSCVTVIVFLYWRNNQGRSFWTRGSSDQVGMGTVRTS